MLDHELIAAIESYVDTHGLARALDCVAALCRGKADHVAQNWQDWELAGRWEKAAGILDKTAQAVPDPLA